MAHKRKIDSHTEQQFTRPSRKREIGTKDKKRYILIVSEGEKTEVFYFKGMQIKLPREALLVIETDGAGMETKKVVEKAIALRQKAIKNENKYYDEVWAVFDRDSFPPQRFNEAIFTARENNIGCAWSNEAFELWYLLHFQYRNTAMNRTDYRKSIENELNEVIKKETGKKGTFSYSKNHQDMYNLLQQYGNQEQAIRNAQKLEKMYDDERYAEHNPCTMVHKLIQSISRLINSSNPK